jgi:hypothetical protein
MKSIDIYKDKSKRQEANKGIHILLREVKDKLDIIDALDERQGHIELSLDDAVHEYQVFMSNLLGYKYKTIREVIKAAKMYRNYIKTELGVG